jgi:N-acetylglucosamine kinase-like BadF-type ATPase
MARFYLGIDGGQSSTTALIADESAHIVGEGRGGPCNHVAQPDRRAKFVRVISQCIAAACQHAALDPAAVTFSAACFGFSGGAEDKESCIRQLLRSATYKFTHDAEIALTGAHAGEPGIVMIAGTGSMAFGRNAAGATARAGGWGYIFGDEGGAFDLVRRALRAALQYEEGWGRATVLRDLLLRAAGAPNANALMHDFYNRFARDAVASLAPLVTQAADDGDLVAVEIVKQACRKLAWYVQGVYGHLFHPGEIVPIVHIGGVFQSASYRNAFADCVRASINCETRPPRFNPAIGAIIEALKLDGNPARPRDSARSEP